MTRSLWLSCVALLAVLVAGLTYLMVALVQVDPRHTPYDVGIHLPWSGGLLERSNVSLRGDVIGRVSKIRLATDGGVDVDLEIQDGVKLPADTDVIVGALSVAGEQYVDFRPRSTNGPLLTNGSEVMPRNLTMPVPFSKLLADLVSFADDLDPRDVRAIGHELAQAVGGTGDDLQHLVANSSRLIAILEESRPDTVSLIDHASAALNVVTASSTDLRTIGRNSRTVAHALRESDEDLRTLLRRGGPTTMQFTGLVRQTEVPFAEGLTAWEQLLAVVSPSTPALAQVFPAIEFGTDRAGAVLENAAIVVLLDLSPNRYCSYGTPFRSPAIGGRPPVRLYRYCDETAANSQQRGPNYAPRGPHDKTATAPPGVSGEETYEDRP